MSFSKSSKARLTARDLDRFPGTTLFDRAARAICGAGCLPRKELYEAWEVARRVRRLFRGGRVVDLGGGHGVLAQLMLLIDDESAPAVVVDRALPPSSAKLHRALSAAWPRLADRVTFLSADIGDVAIESTDVVVSAHACGALTDVVLDRAARAGARVAVLPCCHDLKVCDPGPLAGWIDGPAAIDVMRAVRLEQRGYRVWTQTIPATITPKHRLLLGAPVSAGSKDPASIFHSCKPTVTRERSADAPTLDSSQMAARPCVSSKRKSMNRREAERFVTAFRDARAADLRAVIATVVRVRGSAYRRAGSRLLIREDGVLDGSFWGGIIERAIADDAAGVIETGEPMIVTYDLADESPEGLGTGCPGEVDVLFERAGDDAVTNAWLPALERGDVAVRMTAMSGASGSRLLYASGYSIGHLDDPAIERLADDRATERLHRRQSQCEIEDVGGAEVLFDVSAPPTELVIFGAGYDAEVLARQAWWLGFVVLVVDSRGGYVDPDRFPGANVVFAPSDRLDESVVIADGSFVVLMNHHFERDQDALRFSLESGAAYIGVLGPRSRVRRMIANLIRGGYVPDRATLLRISSPIGLALGAETPEEVAMSIAAEILASARDKSRHEAHEAPIPRFDSRLPILR